MGIFFSCRHYPILHLDQGTTIALDEENAADINAYVQRCLLGDHYDIQIRWLISERAKGVFMWAHFVVKRVLNMTREAEPQNAIEAEI